MPKQLSEELDHSLREFIAEPDHFLKGLQLMYALHNSPVLAASVPYIVDVSGEMVIPVFTNEKDLAAFKKENSEAKEQTWVKRPTLKVLEDAVLNGISGLAYNLKSKGDMGNSTLFRNNDMLQFMKNYTKILNPLLSDANQKADLLDKVYLVPAIINLLDEGRYTQTFPTLADPHGNRFIPIFTNVASLAKWYENQEFGTPFRMEQGTILAWNLAEIYHPPAEESEIDDTTGVVVNPFDEQQVLIEWSNLD